MNYCVKCGKPVDNGMICEDCMINDSPWLSAMKIKENDLEQKITNLEAENAELRERLEKAVLNHNVYYIASIWNDATLTRMKEVICKTVDYVCDKFVECGGLILNWDKIYFTREAALARLAEEGKDENN